MGWFLLGAKADNRAPGGFYASVATGPRSGVCTPVQRYSTWARTAGCNVRGMGAPFAVRDQSHGPGRQPQGRSAGAPTGQRSRAIRRQRSVRSVREMERVCVVDKFSLKSLMSCIFKQMGKTPTDPHICLFHEENWSASNPHINQGNPHMMWG